MQKSLTYDYEQYDHINRAKLAEICSQYFGIKDVSSNLYSIAAPVSELAYCNKNGDRVNSRDEIEEAIPWNERSMKTFGVVYRFEAIASFIGIDGKTYIVPNDIPILEHLADCGYVIAPDGKGLDGDTGLDTLISPPIDNYIMYDRIDRNLPDVIVAKIEEAEKGRPYYTHNQSYAELVRFGGTLGILSASDQELLELSLSERKVANITTYGRVRESQNLDEYIQNALNQFFLTEENLGQGTSLK